MHGDVLRRESRVSAMAGSHGGALEQGDLLPDLARQAEGQGFDLR